MLKNIFGSVVATYLLMNVEKAPSVPATFSASFLTVKSSERERVSLVSRGYAEMWTQLRSEQGS